MTGEHARHDPPTERRTVDGPPAPRPPEPGVARKRLVRALLPHVSRGQLLAGVMCAVLGFALVTQVRQTQEEGIASLRQSDLVRILTGLNEQSERLEDEARSLEGTREELTTGSDTSAAAEQAARERLAVLGILAGTSPATGPGIELIVDDPDAVVTAPILLDALQELRDAGAEAIQIGDVRVVASTALVDTPDGIEVGGRRVGQPYRYRVIGDPQTLAAALDIPGGVLEVLDQQGARGRVVEPGTVTIDALRPLDEPEYARPAPDATP